MNRLIIAAACVLGSRVAAAQPSANGQVDSALRYMRPGECARVVPRMERVFWRDKQYDTVYQGSRGYPPQRSAVDAARQCVDRFVVTEVPQGELLELGRAYISAEQPGRAEAAFARLLALLANRPVSERGWALSQMVTIYARAHPAMIETALAYQARLDSLGAAAAAERLVGHLALIEQAQFMDSVPLIEREATAAITASREMRGDARKQMLLYAIGAYAALVDVRAQHENPTGALVALDSAVAELSAINPMIGPRANGYRRAMYKTFGQPAPALQATWWFGDHTGGHRPVPNTPSLIVFVWHGCGEGCSGNYAVLRRLHAAYPTLDITLVAKTEGFFRNALIAKPEDEAEKIRWYFLDFLKLPAALAVWRTDFGHREDRSLTILSAPNDQAYGSPSDAFPVPAVLVDRTGKLVLITGLDIKNEALLRHRIRELQ